MGGWDNGNDNVAVPAFAHCDANNFGSASLTRPDPLAGLNKLASQVVAAGIKREPGDVIVDDRLFKQFRGPNQLLQITPIIINDNLIDVAIIPHKPGQKAMVEWRRQPPACKVRYGW